MSYPGKYFIDTIAAYKCLAALLNLEDRWQVTHFQPLPLIQKSFVELHFYVWLIAASVHCARWLNLLAWVGVQASRLEFKLCLISSLRATWLPPDMSWHGSPGESGLDTAPMSKTVQLCYEKFTLPTHFQLQSLFALENWLARNTILANLDLLLYL